MAATLVDNGDGTHTLSFVYTALTQKLQDVATDAAHFLYAHKGVIPGPWADLTAQDKIDMLDNAIRADILRMAKRYYVVAAEQTAADTAQSESETRYDLG